MPRMSNYISVILNQRREKKTLLVVTTQLETITGTSSRFIAIRAIL